MIYMTNLVNIHVSGTYLAIMYEVDNADGCVWHVCAKMLGLYIHLA